MTIWPKAVLLLSGGVDSVTLLHEIVGQYEVRCLSFYYGQSHDKELSCANYWANKWRVPMIRVDLPGQLFAGSSLTKGKLDVGAKDSAGVVVPNRNSTFLNIAASYAASFGGEYVFFAANKDDEAGFKDCRIEFVQSLNRLLELAGVGVKVCAPYAAITKAQIMARGKKLGVDYSKTWSCYAGGEEPCGKCNACKLLDEAQKGA